MITAVEEEVIVYQAMATQLREANNKLLSVRNMMNRAVMSDDPEVKAYLEAEREKLGKEVKQYWDKVEPLLRQVRQDEAEAELFREEERGSGRLYRGRIGASHVDAAQIRD